MSKHLPRMKSDREVRRLLKRDLSAYISKEIFLPATFEFAPKDRSITLRVSAGMLNAVQSAAKKRKVNYQKLIREAIELFLRKAA